MEPEITPEKAAFIEEKTKQMFDYTIECFDRAHSEGNNMLQWLFGVITGGMGLIGALEAKNYHSFTVGAGCAVIAASYAAAKLVTALKSRQTLPPGNLAASLETMLEDPIARMRWREARGMDDRIQKNLLQVESLATAVDRARTHFATIPAWFIGGTAAAYVTSRFFLML